MNAIIKYFLDNVKLNYTLLAFIFFVGVISYKMLPKELFPNVALNTIIISGNYAGASPQSLNSFAVTDIEENIAGIAGIAEIRSIIQANTFSISAELEDSADPKEVLDFVKDAVALARMNFPSDMNDPAVTIMRRNRPLVNLTLSSHTLDTGALLERTKALQLEVQSMEHISEVVIYGDANQQVDIYFDVQKMQAYGIQTSSVIQAIQEFSYIYPVGEVDQKLNHIYLSTQDGKTNLADWNETLINIAGKKLYLGDIADITIGYPQNETISRFNLAASITMKVLQGETGDAIRIVEKLKKVIADFEAAHTDVVVDISLDRSKPIKDRLNTVISNILLGLILVGVVIYFFISPRLSIVIILGVPFSFLIAFAALYGFDLSMNMITLLALLITIGIIVDDAIIVSENIQRHLDEGMPRYEAVLFGTKEVIAPVFIASATTAFAFMPMMMLSGSMGAIIWMIPVVVTLTVAASLVESFLFLPLHAKHILRRNEKMVDWKPLYEAHARLLHFLVYYKKSFLLLFAVIVPVLTVLSFKHSHFQFFPRMDSDSITMSVQLDKSLDLAASDAMARAFEEAVWAQKKELYIKNIGTTVGLYTAIDGVAQQIENGFTLSFELEEFNEDNWIQNYLNPIFTLTFDFEQKEKIRTLKTYTIITQLRTLLAPLQENALITDMNIIGQRHGVVRTDIELNLASERLDVLLEGLRAMKAKLASIEGVVDITDNAKMGKEEHKFTINSYGAALGLSESMIARSLSNFYLEKIQSTTLDHTGVVNIVTQIKQKDSIEALKNFQLTVGDRYVALGDVVDFEVTENFAKIEKVDLKTYKTIFANVDTGIITAGEVLKIIAPDIAALEALGVQVIIGGEEEKRKEMMSQMGVAFTVALFLIFMVLLINFNSFKIVLIILSVIPFTVLGALAGHFIMGMNLTFPSMIGLLGLAGVVINDGIVMLDFLKHTTTLEEFYARVKLRVRPILITSITTLLGLSTLIFYPSGQGVFLQPLAISLGFGLLWGTVLNLLYLPALFALLFKLK